MYKILKSTDDQKLANKVNEVMRFGGQPLGGMMIGFDNVINPPTGKSKKVQMFYQAVWLIKEEPNVNLGDFQIETPVEKTNDISEL